MRGRGVLSIGMFLVVAAVVGFLWAVNDRPEAGNNEPEVVILRCLAMTEPSFSYQVATISHTAVLDLDIDASTEAGDGDDCAAAIAEVLKESDADADDMTISAHDGNLVITFVK